MAGGGDGKTTNHKDESQDRGSRWSSLAIKQGSGGVS